MKTGQCQKWQHPMGDTNAVGPRAVVWMDGLPKAHCKYADANGTPCGYNTTHSTQYHKHAMRLGKAFKLSEWSPQHALVAYQMQAPDAAPPTTAAQTNL